MHDSRVKTGVGLQYALSDYGADHMKAPHWSEPLRLDTLSLNTPCIPESYSLPITSHIPLEADSPKMNATSYYYTHLL